MLTLGSPPPYYEKDLKRQLKRFRRVEEDLAEAFAEILADHRTACNARPIPDYRGEVWKYRCGSRDKGCGQSGGFRIIMRIDLAAGIATPLILYTKEEFATQPPKADIEAANKAARSGR